MLEVIYFPNACAALVAEVASQSTQATILASGPCTAMVSRVHSTIIFFFHRFGLYFKIIVEGGGYQNLRI